MLQNLGMATPLIDPTAAAIVGSVVTLVGVILTHRLRMRKSNLDYWTELQEAQAKFQAQIHDELSKTKGEREELRQKVGALEHQVSELVKQNEKLMIEKIEWMQKTAGLQLLLQKAMQSFNINSNQPLTQWFESEIEKLELDVEQEGFTE